MSGNLLTPQMLQLATALGGLFDAQREGAANITVGHASLVRVHVASAITGYSVKAIEKKIEDGVWVEGAQYVRAPDGNLLIDMDGYAKWARSSGSRSKSAKRRSGSAGYPAPATAATDNS